MNKKVGIITSYLDFDKNYGGILQAYALSKQIELLGYNAVIMPYIYEHIPLDKKGNYLIWRLLRKLKNAILIRDNEIKKQRKMNEMMLLFVKENLPLYRTSRMTISDLEFVSKSFYAFICGSDQVWSTKLQQDHCDPGMFLKFVPRGVKKIAYAPSTGSTIRLKADTASEFNMALSTFNAISVRESAGQKLIKDMTNKDVPIVLDPTLLLPADEWEKIVKIPEELPGKYILVYRFGTLESTYEHIMDIQKETGLQIIELPSSAISIKDSWNKRYNIDPEAFIGIIKNATLVCTDSFHATVFSILNRTPFITFYRQEPSIEGNMNCRIDDLLQMTGLTDRLVKPNDKIILEDLFTIDFKSALEKIDQRRTESLNYLKQALREDNNESIG
ncbi:MAG: polysaccharide pyruvyl transferase family protein [Erysipelotrichaceae bacterium]|nr:polysaccharide pyruvyl transferase family protein [Erysipelotrichaceae bacterium]